jgi:predicted peptidase
MRLLSVLITTMAAMAYWAFGKSPETLPSDSGEQVGTPEDSLFFEKNLFLASNGDTLPYRLCLPRNYDPEKAYPLVLFLHGSGERGTCNTLPLKHGPLAFARQSLQDQHPCLVLVPQCPKNRRWVEVDWKLPHHDMPERPSRPMEATIELLAEIQRKYSVDVRRLYVTGLSMGGYGTWDLVSRQPGRFAAAVPVCGGGDEARAPQLASLAIWAFHGADDGIVLPERSRNMVSAIRAAGGSPRYTEYAGVGHNAWDYAYSDEQLFEWLFAQYAQ